MSLSALSLCFRVVRHPQQPPQPTLPAGCCVTSQPAAPTTSPSSCLVLDNGGCETLGVVNVDGLHVAVQLLLGVLLVIAFPRDAYAQPVGYALDAVLPDLFVEKGVDPNVPGAL